MCAPKMPKIEPVKPAKMPAPPPAPEPAPPSPILSSDEREMASEDSGVRARRRGTRALRNDLMIPGGGSGVNVPS